MENSEIAAFLAELDEQGIFVYLQEDRLKLRTQLTTVPAEQLARIKACKQALIAYMQQHHQKQGPLSSAQYRIWFIDQYEPLSATYNMCGLLHFSTSVLTADVEQALNTLLTRHQVLKSNFVTVDGNAVQRINEKALLHLDTIEVGVNENKADIIALLDDELQHCFDLENELLFRATLITQQNRGQWLYIAMHHVVADGWSVQILVQQLVDILAECPGDLGSLQQPQLQYLDYVHWEKQFKQTPVYLNQLEYWQTSLKDIELFELPTSYPRKSQKTYHGATHHFDISKATIAPFTHYCQQHSVTQFVGLLSVFYVLLHRYSQKNDVTVGVPVLNRDQPEFEAMVGCFVNTLALRQKLSAEQSFHTLISTTKATVAQGLENQNVALESIIEALGLAKSSAHSALFQILFNYNGITIESHQTSELSADLTPLDNNTAKFDFTLNITESDTGLVGSIDYCTALFDAQLIARMSDDFIALTTALSSAPEQAIGKVALPSILRSENTFTTSNSVVQDDVDLLLHKVMAHSDRNPNKTALVESSVHTEELSRISYAQLNSLSFNFAQHMTALLEQHSTSQLAPIGLLVSRSAYSVLAMFGIMRAGRAYLPIERGTPVRRIMEMLSQAKSQYLITVDKQSLVEADMQLLNEHEISIHPFEGLISPYIEKEFALPKVQHCDSAYVVFTSGTTGKPKGVEISHGALSHYVNGVSERIQFDENIRAGVITGLATDLCLTGIYPVLAGMGTVALACHDIGADPSLIVDALYQLDVNLLKITPSIASELLPVMSQNIKHIPAISYWVLGGEPLTPQLVNTLQSVYPTSSIINHYGPSETCIGVTTYQITSNEQCTSTLYPIGQPLSHATALILDELKQPTPPGMPGELYIGGRSLSTGYINAPEQTADNFVEHESNGVAQLFYRSGDKVKLTPQGDIEYLGRIDNQPKISGYRVDLLDIEAKATALPIISSAVVVCRKLGKLDTLVGYCTLSNESVDLDIAKMKQDIVNALKLLLPEPMVPRIWEIETQLPYLANGKIDRKQLQNKPIQASKRAFVAAQTDIEHTLVALFSQLTGHEKVSVTDDFFAIGGHSLLAMRLLNLIRQQLDVNISLKALFAYSSVAELAAYLCQTSEKSGLQGIVALEHHDLIGVHPLSFSQQRLWFVDQMQGHSEQYNLQGVYTLKGNVNIVALQQAFQRVIARHKILHFNYQSSATAEATQSLNSQLAFTLAEIDLCDSDNPSQQQVAQTFIADDYSTSFDLTDDLLLRATLLKFDTQCYQLIVTMHHIVSDGWSISILCKELSESYNNLVVGNEHCAQTALPYHYIDYVYWQRTQKASQQWQDSCEYWRSQLDGLPTVHTLPTDRARSNNVISGGGLFKGAIPKGLTKQLRRFNKASSQTLFLTLKSVFTLWFSRISEQYDIAIGTPVAGRELAEFEPIIGNFINTLVLRSQMSSDTDLAHMLRMTKVTLSDALVHQQLPFEALVDALNIERSLSIHPLMQVVFRANNDVNETLQLDGLIIEQVESGVRSAKLDLEVSVIDSGDAIDIEWLYDTALWNECSIKAFFEQYCYVLQQCLDDIHTPLSKLQLWTDQAQSQFIYDTESLDLTVAQQPTFSAHFSSMARQYPHYDALLYDGRAYSYEKIEQCANQLAHCLLEMTFEPQSRIAILLPSGPAMVVAILAILRAGHTYVPLHSNTPSQTLNYIVDDAELMMILAYSDDTDTLVDSGSDFLLLDDIFDLDSNFCGYDTAAPKGDERAGEPCHKGEDICYIIYTSGSTGKPKGVMISHDNLSAYLQHAVTCYKPKDGVIWSSVVSTPLAFDATVTALFPPLMHGGTVEIIPEGGEQLVKLTDVIFSSMNAKLFKLTPAHLRAIVGLSKDKSNTLMNHTLVVGGEALEVDLLAALRKKLPYCRWVNEYGPTETTVGSTTYTIDDTQTTLSNGIQVPPYTQYVNEGHKDVPIGIPNSNVIVRVVDRFNQLTPLNMPGELLIGGPVVSQGYVNLAGLNDERFVTLTFMQSNGKKRTQRFYRTGDIAFWQSDKKTETSYLRYSGRIDEQVKLRGFRIDVCAIEHTLRELNEVSDCAVTVDVEQAVLHAHIVMCQGHTMVSRLLKSQLANTLPHYMVPSLFFEHDGIPVTKNGKVDKTALTVGIEQRDLEPKAVVNDKDLTPLQSYLLNLFRETLLLEHIGIEDSFFDIGGHSLLAIRLIGQIREQKHFDITLPQLFKTPSVAALTDALQSCQKITHAQEIVKVSRQQALPLSYAQQRLWLIDQVQQSSTQYHMPASFIFNGKLNLKAVSSALHDLITRHEVLRTIIVNQNGSDAPEQKINSTFSVPLKCLDLTELSQQEQDEQWAHIAFEASTAPFDLAHDVMLRVVVAKMTEQTSLVHFNMHHIASDGWSMAILIREFVAYYRTHTAEQEYQLPQTLAEPLSVQYADYAYWQRLVCSENALNTSLDYWRSQLQGAPHVHELPLDFTRPQEQQLVGASVIHHLNAATTKAIHQQCADHGVTLYMWLHTVFSVLVMKYSQSQDVLIGSPVAGRDQAQVSDLIGFFVNTLVIRSQTQSKQCFTELLAQQKQVIVDAFKHQHVPFEQLVEVLQPERNLAHQPLFQILFALQNNEVTDFTLPHLHIEQHSTHAVRMKFDLEVNAIEQGDGIHIQWNYNTSLFKKQRIEQLTLSFEVMIAALLTAPSQQIGSLSVMSADTRQRLLAEELSGQEAVENNLRLSPEPHTRHVMSRLNKHWHSKTGSNEGHLNQSRALIDIDGRVMSYADLVKKTDQLAGYLQSKGIGKASKIAICLPASSMMIIAILAVAKIGGAYVPIDPKQPISRRQYILDDSGSELLITTSQLDIDFNTLTQSSASCRLLLNEYNWQQEMSELAPVAYDIDDLAYIIYTSGTTGMPKGVQITHRNLSMYLDHVLDTYLDGDQSISVVSTPLAFDATVTSIWGPLLTGMCLDILVDDTQMLTQLSQRLQSEHSGFFKVTPAHLQGILALLPQKIIPTAHQVIIGGEKLPLPLLQSLSEYFPNIQWVNEYGPTEATVGTSVYRCNAASIAELDQQQLTQVPIGNAIANSRLVVLDTEQQLAPVGAIGELYIAGDNLALGYLNQPSLTNQCFNMLPLGPEGTERRFYRTGDKVRWHINEQMHPEYLLFYGRVDEQVKLRGYRIELNEIAHQLRRHGDIDEAQVLLNPETEQLEAFIISQQYGLQYQFSEQQRIQPVSNNVIGALKEHLAALLPTYMIPHKWMVVEHIPLTHNGKVDSKQLLNLSASITVESKNIAANNDFERALIDIFSKILGADSMGITDNFFALGGHSLLATQCMAMVKETLDVDIPVRVLFERPTIEALSKWYSIQKMMTNTAPNDNESDTSEEMFL
ncbi:non-ribosomal peptide synthetase [Pseudoalteromonas aurantia]|uniref:Carrier domain-containing protein n=1 Tax=Pseudoalteromonas aurantia 208 TaxID=1314867 RepID=A0ABR9E9Q9_9GAMM|nr:non-ribosomal peptide synthetase [Pseudoalteromonas aurantia]MBE0367740.1 hypothetical protein [Pseudoalteromonas aurantia 208]